MACTDINSEDRLVQKTFAEHLHDKLGWDSAYAWNNEVFGTLQPSPHPSRSGRASEGGGVACDLGRTDTREVVLTRDLRAALERLNPLLPPAAITEAIQEITRHDFTRSLLQHNQAFYKLIRDGVPVSYKDANGVQRDARARVIDFKNERGADGQPNNRFLAVRELKITGLRTPGYNRRADIVCFVNGLPLVFIELKAIYKNIRRGFEDNLRDYMQQDTIPHAFHHNAFLIVSNGHRARYGSITSGWEHFAEWKRLAETDKGSVEAEVLLNGMLSHERLLDIVENFILFDGSKPGGTRKIVASNHQVLGVNNALASVRRHISAKFTFLLMTDRNDLDGQLYKTFVGCGIVEAEATPRASSGKDLERLLKENHRYIFSLIHKFNQDVDPREPYSKRDDIIVISDEAHRTQAGRLARNMRLALPNAAFIGFTGTPLFKHDHLTKRIFGGYGSKYDFKRLRTARTQLSIHATRDGVGLRFWRGRFSSGSKHWLQGSRRMPMQRELFTVLPTPPFTEDEKAVMAQRVYQHIWQQSTSGLFWVTA